MAPVKTILSMAVASALIVAASPSTALTVSDDGSFLLAASQGSQAGANQQAGTPRGDQTQDRTRLRLDPQGTPNPEPPGKNPHTMDMQDDMDQDRDRTRLREDPQGTPNEDPKENNPR